MPCAPTPSSTPSWARTPDAGPEATDADASSGKAGGQSEGSSQVQLRVSVDLPTLLGLADNPAELAGHGPIPPQLARELAGDADWTRLTTHPQTGELLDLAPRRYRPSRRLAAFIRARQPVCTWPGCNQPAERCELDHNQDFGTGGDTCRCNLGPFCRQHHNAKTPTADGATGTTPTAAAPSPAHSARPTHSNHHGAARTSELGLEGSRGRNPTGPRRWPCPRCGC
jgi:hypothetical protein